MSVTEHTYPVREIFYSLQGEGIHTGTAAVFIRFAGCNLKCSFCDTDHTSVIRNMTAGEIATEVNRYPCRHIVLTGGEPTLSIDPDLIYSLKHHKEYYIQIETNGTKYVPALDYVDWITCSPKVAKRVLPHIDELKVVMLPSDSFDPEVYAELYDDASVKCIQPCSCVNTSEVIAYILKHPHWRLSIQTHKYINIQ